RAGSLCQRLECIRDLWPAPARATAPVHERRCIRRDVGERARAIGRGLEGPPFACSQALARCRPHRLDRELGEVDGRSGWRPATAPRCAARPPVRVPDVRAAPCNLVHRAPALDRRVDVGGDVVAASRRVVAMLDQQPLRFRAAVRAYECKGAAETLTLEGDAELPLLEPATND